MRGRNLLGFFKVRGHVLSITIDTEPLVGRIQTKVMELAKSSLVHNLLMPNAGHFQRLYKCNEEIFKAARI
jgi:hypothetical protein